MHISAHCGGQRTSSAVLLRHHHIYFFIHLFISKTASFAGRELAKYTLGWLASEPASISLPLPAMGLEVHYRPWQFYVRSGDELKPD